MITALILAFAAADGVLAAAVAFGLRHRLLGIMAIYPLAIAIVWIGQLALGLWLF